MTRHCPPGLMCRECMPVAVPVPGREYPKPRRLAIEFVKVIERWLSAAQMREVRRRNARRRSAITCATHDFCDANMAMAEAWDRALKRAHDPETGGPESDDDYATDVWNAAWHIADRYFLGGSP